MTARHPKSAKPLPSPTPEQLAHVSGCLRRWARVLLAAGDGAPASGLGIVKLTWRRSEPGVLRLDVSGATKDGFRGDIGGAMSLYQAITEEDVRDAKDAARSVRKWEKLTGRKRVKKGRKK